MITDAVLKLLEKDPTVKRHLLKTVSWRIIGSIDTVLLAWLISGRIDIGAKIGSIELITKMVLYFFHERVWQKYLFGVPSRYVKAEKIKKENASNLFLQKSKVSRQQREEMNENKSFTIWLTGLSASGKSTIAAELDGWFFKNGLRSYVIDGDNTRLGINSDLSFSKEDRTENIRRVAEISRLFNDAGTIVIASFISPFEEGRMSAKKIIGEENFIETFVDASINTCKARDKKGLYKLAESGKIKDFTGISSPYEAPTNPAIHLHTDTESISTCLNTIIKHLHRHKLVAVPEKANLQLAL
jgi:adenylylsulfate kinase